MVRLDNATGWRRRALRLVELCSKLDAEHVLCKAMRRWPVAALLEATEGWSAELFALVARDWRLRKVSRLLEAKGRAFTVECCEEWEPEFLQVLLPEVDLVTARHVLGRLYFKSDDKHLSAYECRGILEQFSARQQRKLLRKFEERDVSRVLNASEEDADGDEEEDDEGGEDEEGEDEDDSLDGFLVHDECEEEGEGDEEEEDEEEEEGEGEDEDGEGLFGYEALEDGDLDEEEEDEEADHMELLEDSEDDEDDVPVVVEAVKKKSGKKESKKEAKGKKEAEKESKKGAKRRRVVSSEGEEDDDDE